MLKFNFRGISKAWIQKGICIRRYRYAILISNLLIGFTVGAVCFLIPNQNWDSIGYAHSALRMAENDESKVHAKVFQELKTTTSLQTFNSLTQGNFYQRQMFTDIEGLAQIRGTYSVKYLYVLLIYGLHNLGLNAFVSMHILSALFAGLSFILSTLLIRNFSFASYPLYLIPLISIIQVGRMSTPDSMGMFLIFLVFYFCNRKWNMLSQLFLVTAPLVRPEFLILSLICFFLFRQWGFRIRFFLSAITILLTLSIAISQQAWSYTKSIKFLYYLTQNPNESFYTFQDMSFFQAYFKLITTIIQIDLPLLILLSFSLYLLMNNTLRIFPLATQRVFGEVLLYFSIVRIIVFPSGDYRFYSPFIIFFSYVFVEFFHSLNKSGSEVHFFDSRDNRNDRQF